MSERRNVTNVHSDAAVKTIVSALTKALNDEDSSVRNDVARALENVRRESKAAVPALIASLKDEDFEVCQEAAEALGKFGPRAKATIAALMGLLNDTDTMVRHEAARADGSQSLGEDQEGNKVAKPQLRFLALLKRLLPTRQS